MPPVLRPLVHAGFWSLPILQPIKDAPQALISLHFSSPAALPIIGMPRPFFQEVLESPDFSLQHQVGPLKEEVNTSASSGGLGQPSLVTQSRERARVPSSSQIWFESLTPGLERG